MGFRFDQHPGSLALAIALVIVVLFTPVSAPIAQQGDEGAPEGNLLGRAGGKAQKHLNPVIEKLSKGETVFGVQTSDMSYENARALARAPIDFVYVDMEHTVLRMEALENFLAYMQDRRAIAAKGNVTFNVAVFARFPPYAEENTHWVVKQALDIGLMGIMFPGTDKPEQALKQTQYMRLFRQKSDPLFEPEGMRGSGGGPASWAWGIAGGDNYYKMADVWPLNPNGELVNMPMIESPEGIANIDKMAQIKGITAFYTSSGGDLHMSMGVPAGDPTVEEAYLKMIQHCQAIKAVCGGTVTPRNLERYVNAGARILRMGGAGGGLSPGAAAMVRQAQTVLQAQGKK